MKIELPEIKCNFEGYQKLINIYTQCKDATFKEIEIDILKWIDANMCAPLGAILNKIGQTNTIKIGNVHNRIAPILSKNGFLGFYGWEKNPDTYQTTVEYKKFDIQDIRYFNEYIMNGLLTKKSIPKMMPKLRKKFILSIGEIFDNAVFHSQSNLGIFSCGQFFPMKKCLDFSIADLGIGIRQNVKDKKQLDFTSDRAIQWALEGNNTTKEGSLPGGSGLKILREFISLNKGKFQIVSDNGFWELDGKLNREESKLFNDPFPGTIVTIVIDTADKNKYGLSSEIRPEDIFK